MEDIYQNDFFIGTINIDQTLKIKHEETMKKFTPRLFHYVLIWYGNLMALFLFTKFQAMKYFAQKFNNIEYR